MAEKETKPAPSRIAALRIRSFPARFYRAGLEFTREPRVIAVADLARAQIEALRAEPALHVEDVEIDAPAPDAR